MIATQNLSSAAMILFALVLSTTAGCAEQPNSVPATPRAYFATPRIDAGKIEKGSEHLIEIPYENRGVGDLRLVRVTTSCGCALYRLNRPSVAPLESSKITIALTPRDTGRKSVFVKVESNDLLEPETTIEIEYDCVAPLVAIPSRIDFGELRVDGTATREVVVRASFPISAGATVITSSSPMLEVNRSREADRQSLGPRGIDLKFQVCLLPDGSRGEFIGWVRLVGGGHELQIPVTWSRVANVTVVPERLFLGRVPGGNKARARLVVKASQGDRLDVDSLAASADSDRISLRCMNAGTNAILIELDWTAPTSVGEFRSTISISETGPAAWIHEVPVSMIVQELDEGTP